MRNCGQRPRLGKSRVEPRPGRTSSLSVLLFQSWCKQPCWCELVPVSGQDRAHRPHSDAAPRLCPPLSHAAPNWGKKPPPRPSMMDFTTWRSRLQTAGNEGRKKPSSRCTDRTDWYTATLQCSSGERPYSNHATQGKAPVISVDLFFFWVLRVALAVAAAAAAADKLTSQISLGINTKLARHMS